VGHSAEHSGREKFHVEQLFIILFRLIRRRKFSTYCVAVHAYTCTTAAVTYRENGSFRVLFAAFSAILRETNRGLSQFRNQSAKRDKHPDEHKLFLEAFSTRQSICHFFFVLYGIPLRLLKSFNRSYAIQDCGLFSRTCESVHCLFAGHFLEHYGGRISSG